MKKELSETSTQTIYETQKRTTRLKLKLVTNEQYYKLYVKIQISSTKKRIAFSSDGLARRDTGKYPSAPLVNTLFDAPTLNKIMKRVIKLLK